MARVKSFDQSLWSQEDVADSLYPNHRWRSERLMSYRPRDHRRPELV